MLAAKTTPFITSFPFYSPIQTKHGFSDFKINNLTPEKKTAGSPPHSGNPAVSATPKYFAGAFLPPI